MTIPNSPLMREILSSAPTRFMKIPAIMISIDGTDPICLCHAYRDYDLEIDGVVRTFIGSQITYSMPKKDTTGGQTLSFGFAGVSREASEKIRIARDTEAPVKVELLIFIEDAEDKTHQLGLRLRKMELLDSNINGDVCTFQAQYNGTLTNRYPREFYTSESAPGITYIS